MNISPFNSSIQDLLENIEKRINSTSKEDQAKIRTATNLTFEELIAMQNKQAIMSASQIFPLYVRMFLFETLGGNSPTVEKWNKKTTAERYLTMHLLLATENK